MNSNNSTNPNNSTSPPGKLDPATQRKADRALIILYIVMFLFITVPFVVYFLVKK